MDNEGSGSDEDSATSKSDRGPIAILHVEHNPNDVELTKRAFEGGKISNNPHVINNGVEAMQFLRQQGEFTDTPRPDIALLDLGMARKGGKEVLEAIDQDLVLSKSPLVVLTSSNAEPDIVDSDDYSATAYLTKPVGHQEYQETVRQIQPFRFDTAKTHLI